MPDCKDASCCVYSAKTLGRTTSAWKFTWFTLGSSSAAGRNGQQGGKVTHCPHVLTGSTSNRPTCPAVLVVSPPRRAQCPDLSWYPLPHQNSPLFCSGFLGKQVAISAKRTPLLLSKGDAQQELHTHTHPALMGDAAKWGYWVEGLWKQDFLILQEQGRLWEI